MEGLDGVNKRVNLRLSDAGFGLVVQLGVAGGTTQREVNVEDTYHHILCVQGNPFV